MLALSTSKCKALCISNKKSALYCLYYINSISLEWVDSFRYLGVCIDHKLKWASHVADITVKASKPDFKPTKTVYVYLQYECKGKSISSSCSTPP